MLSSTDKQKGAVMIEAAYVLPLMVGVTLFIVEAVVFAMNSLGINDVLTDVHTSIISEVSEVANADSYASLKQQPTFVKCEGGKVTLNTDPSPINGLVNEYLLKRKISVKSGSGATVAGPTVISGFDAYVISYKAILSDTVILPEWASGLLPVNVDTIVSIKDSCNP